MDGLHLGGGGSQLSKDQLLPLQPLALQQQQLQLFSQSRTGSVLLLRTSRSPSATRSTEQTS